MIKEFKAFFDALKYGKAIANARALKQAQIWANNFAAFAVAALTIACGFNYCFSVDVENLKALGGGIAAAFAIFNSVATTASSEKVGLGRRNGAE